MEKLHSIEIDETEYNIEPDVMEAPIDNKSYLRRNGEWVNAPELDGQVINITDGEYNGTTDDMMVQLSNELKSMFTNDGNVLFFNIHIVPEQDDAIVFPAVKDELNGDRYGENLFAMSSLLPLVYNDQIKQIFNVDINDDVRYRALGVNAGMERLVKMMKIGTLSSTLVSNL